MKFSVHVLSGLILLLSGCGGDAGEEHAGGTPDRHAAASPAGTAEPVIAESEAPAVAPAAFVQCRSCHSVETGQNGIGPSLHGIFGKQAASQEAFGYSPALKQSGIVWDRESLDKWIAAPMTMVPGTRMVVGVPDADARRQIIDYLETLN